MARLGLYELLPHRTGEEGGTPAEFKANLKRKVKCIRNAGTYDRVVIAATRQRLKATTGATSTRGSMNSKAQQAKRTAQEAERRSRDASRQPRLANGTFAPPQETIDQSTDPVSSATGPGAQCPSVWTWDPEETIPLQLTAAEDSASIQLALIEVLQSLAAHQLDPKRAGLLLYGLQVASANAKNVHVHANSIRSISYTKEGIPLATQEHGWDVEDMEEADRQAEEEGEED